MMALLLPDTVDDQATLARIVRGVNLFEDRNQLDNLVFILESFDQMELIADPLDRLYFDYQRLQQPDPGFPISYYPYQALVETDSASIESNLSLQELAALQRAMRQDKWAMRSLESLFPTVVAKRSIDAQAVSVILSTPFQLSSLPNGLKLLKRCSNILDSH
jgi:hypothetical protein